jgi:hypothetical protein
MTSFMCLRCSTTLSENSERCPNCGNPLKLSKGYIGNTENSVTEPVALRPSWRAKNRIRTTRRFVRRKRKVWLWLIVILLVLTIGQGRARTPLEVWQSTRALGNTAVQAVFPDNVLKKNLIDRPKNVELDCPKVSKSNLQPLGIMNSDQSSCEYKADLKWLIDHTTFQGLTNYRICTQQWDALYGMSQSDPKKVSKGKGATQTLCSLNLQAAFVREIA